ncbi:hypothetical protein OIO90_002468 [Microbotryomycetes sp. JL221]|nr:hypothetical protein OIO90_002468 [Microbotryomycetes sp. JL221]
MSAATVLPTGPTPSFPTPTPPSLKHTQSRSKVPVAPDIADDSDESEIDAWVENPPRSPTKRASQSKSAFAVKTYSPEIDSDDDSGHSTIQAMAKDLADLRNWAPDRPVELSRTQYAHLPPVRMSSTVSTLDLRAGQTAMTSQPITEISPLQASISHSLNRLLSVAIFQQFLSSSKGYGEFHRYLTQVSNSSTSVSSLELWRDVKALETEYRRSALVAQGIRDLYLLPTGQKRATDVLTAEDFTAAVGGLSQVMQAGAGLDEVSRHLLERLYRDDFLDYVKYYLIKHTSVELGKYGIDSKHRRGLGEAFVMSNPRLPDQPIVLASDAFCLLTGYDREMIIGRNCRFLQGEATSPESVKNIRKAIDKGEEITELILNYRNDGTPFWNLLCILPLRDARGQVTYFVGGQTNITGTMAKGSGADLSFILGSDEPIALPTSTGTQASSISEHVNVQGYSSTLQAWTKQKQHELGETDLTPELGSNGAVPRPTNSTTNRLSKANAAKARSGSAAGEQANDTSATQSRWRLGFLKKSKRVQSKDGLDSSQLLDSAELFKKPAEGKSGGIESRISQFTAIYEKVLILRQETREILFATPSFLRFCGLPGTSLLDTCSSKLLHQDCIKIIRGGQTQSPADKKSTRSLIKKVMKEGRSASLPCWIQVKEMGAYGREGLLPASRGILHLTPLKDAKGQVSAFVAIFG